MTLADVAVVIGAVGAAATAVAAAFIAVLREVRRVHVLVNQSATDAKAYNLLLSDTLRDHGINVPVDESVVSPDGDHGVREARTPGQQEVHGEDPSG